MIEYIEVINEAGDHLRLPLSNPWETGIAVMNIQGIGTTKANVNMTSYADSDLKKKNGVILDTRNITLTLQFLGTEIKSVEQLRDTAYAFFTPKKTIHFIIKTDYRFVGIDGTVESNEPDIFSKDEQTQISILCENPLWYDETGKDTKRDEYDLNALVSMFEFPFSNESLVDPLIVLGEIRHAPVNAIDYPGEYDVGFIITMHCAGIVIDPIIYCSRQNGYFKLNTSLLTDIIPDADRFLPGDVITIDTYNGSKAIMLLRDGTVYNILHLLDSRSIWPMLKTGKNEFRVDAANGFEYIQIAYQYTTGYLGV